MVDLFPHILDSAETLVNHPFDRLIACTKRRQAPGELWYPLAVAIDSSNNQIYVAEGLYFIEGHPNNTTRVSIFSEAGEFLNTFSHLYMKYPWGIAIHRDKVYITDIVQHSVFHFKAEGDFRLVVRLGGRGSGIGQFDMPRQLAVSTNGDVLVTDRDNNRVQILGSDLHYLRHISHHSLVGPFDIKLTPDEVYILCQSSPCVKVFSYTGDLIRSLVTRDSIGMHVSFLSFFCLNTDRDLFLSDFMGHQIKIFSKEGTLLHTLGEYGHDAGMFNSPKGIALINNLKLVIVSRSMNCCLQIFSGSRC